MYIQPEEGWQQYTELEAPPSRVMAATVHTRFSQLFNDGHSQPSEITMCILSSQIQTATMAVDMFEKLTLQQQWYNSAINEPVVESLSWPDTAQHLDAPRGQTVMTIPTPQTNHLCLITSNPSGQTTPTPQTNHLQQRKSSGESPFLILTHTTDSSDCHLDNVRVVRGLYVLPVTEVCWTARPQHAPLSANSGSFSTSTTSSTADSTLPL